jgi:hypothetical protein
MDAGKPVGGMPCAIDETSYPGMHRTPAPAQTNAFHSEITTEERAS